MFERVQHAVLRADDGGELAENQVADGDAILLALQHAREFGEIGFQPILFLVGERRLLQVADHFVDVVFERGDFALRIDADGTGQIALGHGNGDLGDGAHLGGEVGCQLIDVVGQIFPGSGGAWRDGLLAQLAFDTHFAGHAGHFRGKEAELVNHGVDLFF